MTKTYYKIVCSKEHQMNGAGLGYDEIFGDYRRYWWDRATAEDQAGILNRCIGSCGLELQGTYSIRERLMYADGSWDDDGDSHSADQLGIGQEK